MEDIDLSAYIDVIIKYWKWIVGITVVAAIAGAVVSVLSPTVYQATALVVVTKPQYQMQFDPKFQVVPVDQRSAPFKAYVALATTGELLDQLAGALESQRESEGRPGKVPMGTLTARTSIDDPSLIELTVTNADPGQAARVVNTWAELYVQWLNELYETSDQNKAFFEQQLDEADANLQAIDEEIVAFQAENNVDVLEAQLEAKKSALADYLAVANTLELIAQNARALQERLKLQQAGEFSSLADDLAALLLNIEAFGFVEKDYNSDKDVKTMQGGLAIQLEVPGDMAASSKTVRQQIEYLDDLIVALESKAQAMKAKEQAIIPDILRAQQELQAAKAEWKHLETAQEVAEEIHRSLSLKYKEARIAAESEAGSVRLASKAKVPAAPVPSNGKRNTALGAVLGLAVGILGAFAAEYLQGYRARNLQEG